MLQKITDVWPNLLRQYQGLDIEEDAEGNNDDDGKKNSTKESKNCTRVGIDHGIKKWTRQSIDRLILNDVMR